MDREIIEQKLESLHRCIKRLESKCPADAAILASDFDLQDIVALNLSRAIQICVDIGAHIVASLDVPAPGTMGQTFELLSQTGLINTELASRLKKAVGFRNIAVHNYEKINWNIVHSIVKDHLIDFTEFAKISAETLTANIVGNHWDIKL